MKILESPSTPIVLFNNEKVRSVSLYFDLILVDFGIYCLYFDVMYLIYLNIKKSLFYKKPQGVKCDAKAEANKWKVSEFTLLALNCCSE